MGTLIDYSEHVYFVLENPQMGYFKKKQNRMQGIYDVDLIIAE